MGRDGVGLWQGAWNSGLRGVTRAWRRRTWNSLSGVMGVSTTRVDVLTIQDLCDT